MMLAAALAAVVAAPLFEETAFRLVFQGWLERSRRAVVATAVHDLARRRRRDESSEPSSLDRRRCAGLHPTRIAVPRWLGADRRSAARCSRWPTSGTAWRRCPLFLLGVVLGYLYQRTHRIVPSIVCHVLFNAYFAC